MRFTTTLRKFGTNNTGVEVPEEVLIRLGRGRRVKVVATVNGYTYRTSVAPAMGLILMPFSSEHRKATGLTGGEAIEVDLVPDDGPREVEVPADLAAALADAPAAAAFFDGLSYTNRKAYVTSIEEAKKAETRAARIAKVVERLSEGQAR
jgi:hypothetical protein